MTNGLSISQTMGFMDEEGNGVGEDEVGLRSSSQAKSEGGLGIVVEAFNFERSLPKIGVEHFWSMRKEWGMGYLEVCKVEAQLFLV